MKLLSAVLLICCSLFSVMPARAGEQDTAVFDLADMLRVVEDKDGFVNVREKASADSKVVGKVLTGCVVAISGEPEQSGPWAPVFSDEGKDGVAFIHESRLKSLKEWPQAAGKVDGKTASAAQGGFKATVTEGEFNPAEHKVTKRENYVEKIDGHDVQGTDGTMPDKTLSLTVTLDGKALKLPKEATHDLYQPNLDSLMLLAPGGDKGQAVITMMNSDGAGGYCVAWAFAGGNYIGRTVFIPF